jgi:hypothetical protein
MMGDVKLSKVLDSTLDIVVLDRRLRGHWADFCGISRGAYGTLAHFVSANEPADWGTVAAAVSVPLAMTTDKIRVTAGGADVALIVCADARIAGDATVNYYVDFDGVLDDTPTAAPVVAGRCELEFGTPVAGEYRVRIERGAGFEVGYVTIEAV